MLHGKRGRNYWWVAPTYGQAKIAYRRLAHAIPPGLRTLNESELTISLPNGAVIWFKTGEKPDNLYGEDVYAAVIDEASRLREDAWHAIRSTLTATKGPIRLIGNVKGRKNWFYKMCRKAEAGEPGHKFTRITCHDAARAGIIDAKEIEQARRDLPELVFKELYEASPSDDVGNPFGVSAIASCVKPISDVPLPVVAYGIDLAKSVDWTVIIGLDATGAVRVCERFQSPWTETMDRIQRIVGTTPALVDSTGVGDPVLELLQRQSGNFEGYKFTSESKQKLMEGLAVAIQRGEVSFPAGPLVAELEAFEFTYTGSGVRYSAPEGMHDDCVCAFALALAMKKQSHFTASLPEPPMQHGEFGEREPMSALEGLALG